MEIFNDKFLQIQYNEQENICIANWTVETEKATDNDFKAWNIELVNIIAEKKPHGLLANTLNYRFAIHAELQKWSVTNIFEQYAKAGLTRIAIIVPEEFIAELSLEQFVEEYKENKIETQYFSEVKVAENWLIEK